MQIATQLRQRYTILEKIGEGGFGLVYKASDTNLNGRLVAIKELTPWNLSSEEQITALEAFEQEAMLLGSLFHPHLPRVYDWFVEGNHAYIVMDFVEGVTLEERVIRQGTPKLPLDQILSIALQLCSVLTYLHSHQPPIIFRDLKPANIMITPEGHVYLIDFGIARVFKPGQAKDTVALGSPGYAAPEQYGREQTTPLADLYSLGALLHQLITGDDPTHTPFRFGPLGLSPLNPMGQKLEVLVMSMVEIDIHKRPQSAERIRKEILAIGATNGGATQHSAPAHTTTIHVTKLVYREHMGKVGSAAFSPDGRYVASRSMDGTTIKVWDATSGRTSFTLLPEFPQRVVAWHPREPIIMTGSSSLHGWDTSTGNYISLHIYPPSGGYLINALAFSTMGKIALAQDVETAAYGNPTRYSWISFAGDGKFDRCQMTSYNCHQSPPRGSWTLNRVLSIGWLGENKLVSSGTDGTVQIYNTTFGRIECTYQGHQGTVQTVTCSPDGTLIASGGDDQSVQVWETTGKSKGRYNGHVGEISSIAWSPDGSTIASASDKTVHLWDAQSFALQGRYEQHTSKVTSLSWAHDGRLLSASEDGTIRIWTQ